MQSRLTSLFLIALSFSLIGFAQSAEPRTWTSSEGKSFEGTLQSASEAAATIRRSDGKVFDVPLDKLSEADQGYVGQVVKDQNRAAGLS